MGKISSPIKIYGLFFVVILLWSLSWPIGKFALFYIPPFLLAGLRISIATLCIFIITAFCGKLRLPKRQDLPLIFSIGVLQFFLFTFLSLLGLKYADAGHSAMLSYTTPIWVSLLAYFFLGESLTKIKVISILFGILGIFTLLDPFQLNWSNKQALFGSALLLLSAFSWALSLLSARYLTWHKTPSEIAPWQFLTATVISLPFCFMNNAILHVHWSLELLAAILFLSVIATAFGFWGIVIVSKELPAVTTSIGLLGVPLCSLMAAHFMINESITINKIIAMIFILLALGGTIYSDRQRISKK